MEKDRQRPGEIAGQIINILNEPVPGARVLITGASPSHKDICAETNEQGEYGFDDLVPGDYTILVNAEGHDAHMGKVHVDAGQIARLDISLPD